MDNNDSWVLDGNRLIPCVEQASPAVSCQYGGTHSTESETYQRIVANPDRWTVWGRDGTRSIYTQQPSEIGRIFRLDQRVNTHGDSVHYNHWCDGADACYLKSIEYEDAEDPAWRTRIVFNYEPRPDPITTGTGTGFTTVRYRLLSIEVRTAAHTRSAVAFNYHPPTARSLLKEVVRYGTDALLDANGKVLSGTSLPPEQFGWKPDDDPTGPPTSQSTSGDRVPQTPWIGQGSYEPMNQDADVRFDNFLGSRQALMADFNGDGRDDFAIAVVPMEAPADNIRLELHVSIPGAGFTTRTQETTWPSYFRVDAGSTVVKPYFRLITGDINNDGRADIVSVWWSNKLPPGHVYATAALGNPDGSLSMQDDTYIFETPWSPRTRWFLSDSDGDGLQDLIGIRGTDDDGHGGYNHAQIVVAKSDGSRFLSPKLTDTEWTFEPRDDPHWFVSDANGDGLSDIIRVETLLPAWTARIQTAISKGTGEFVFSTQETGLPFYNPVYDPGLNEATATSPGELANVGDFNGDGRTDLLLVGVWLDPGDHEYTTHLTTAFGRPTNRFELITHKTNISPWYLNSFVLSTLGSGALPNRWVISDFDGDGSSDITLAIPGAGIERVQTDDWPTTLVLARLRSHRDGTFDDVQYPLVDTHWFYDCPGRLPNGGPAGKLPIGSSFYCELGPYQAVLSGDTNGDGRADINYFGLNSDYSTATVRTFPSPLAQVDDFRWISADVTGDGRPEQVYISYENPGLAVSTAIEGRGNGAPTQLVTRNVPSAADFKDPDMRSWITADFGSFGGEPHRPDGKADLLHLSYDPTDHSVNSTTLFSLGGGDYFAVTKPLAYQDDPSVRGFVPVDANGDGLTDLALVTPKGSNGVLTSTFLADGSGDWRPVNSETPLQVPWQVFGSHSFLPTDLDGDGFGDLLLTGRQQNVPPVDARDELLGLRSDGQGHWQLFSNFVLPPWARGAASRWRPAELNGDGRRDLIRVVDDGEYASIQQLVSDGGGNFAAETTQTTSWFAPTWQILDENQDGCDDVAWIRSVSFTDANTLLNRFRNSCQGFAAIQTSYAGYLSAGAGWRPGDVLQLNNQQLVSTSSTSSGQPILTILDTGATPNLIQYASSGLGRNMTVAYKASSVDAYVGGSLGQLAPPGLSLPVVETLKTDDFGGGDLATIRYTYEGLKWAYLLNRTLGFARVTAAEDSKTVVTDYVKSPGCSDAVGSQSIIGRDGATLQRTTTVYDPQPTLEAAPPWICTGSKVTRSECEAGTCRDVVTLYSHDKFANVTATTELGEFTDPDGNGTDDTPKDNRITTSSYQPNTDLWIVSLPSAQIITDPAQNVYSSKQWIYDENMTSAQKPTRGDVRKSVDWEPRMPDAALTTTYERDPHGNVKSETDPAGRTTDTIWDERYARFPKSTCHVLWCTSTIWDPLVGRPLEYHDANELVTVETWDELGRHKRTDFADGGCLIHDYTSWGQYNQTVTETHCTMAGGVGPHGTLSDRYFFDGLHRVWREERPGGLSRTRRFAFSSLLVAWETGWGTAGSPGQKTSYTYDGLDRPLDTIYPDKNVRGVTYMPGSVTTTDETYRVHVRQHFDGLGRISAVDEFPRDANVAETMLFEVDPLDHIVKATDAGGNVTKRTIGPLGWVWDECDSDRGCLSRHFDPDGLLKDETNQASERIEFNYDVIGRKLTEHLIDSTGHNVDTASWSYDYDPDTHETNGYSIGQVTSTYRASDDVKEREWYDKQGRRAQLETCLRKDCIQTGTTWDVAGRLKSVHYPPDPGQQDQPEDVPYEYDESGRLFSVGSYANEITYAPTDQVLQINFGNGVVETTGLDAARGWTRSVTISGLKGQWPSLSTSYPDIDRAGRMLQEMASLPLPHQTVYGYDGAGRISSGPGAYTDYDTAGRPTGGGANGPLRFGDGRHVHAVTQSGSGDYSYDAAGRMLSSPHTKEHVWSPDGRLLSLKTTNSSVHYRYDADGNRVARETDDRSSVYTSDGLVEVEPAGVHLRSYYGAGRLLARCELGDECSYYHPDRRGSIRYVTQNNAFDPAAGPRLRQIYDYDVTGSASRWQPFDPDDLRFDGARQDPDSGFLHLGERDYDPQVGRFLSPDRTVADAHKSIAYDRYAYGYDDPLNSKDASGAAPTSVINPGESSAGSSALQRAWLGVSSSLESAWTSFKSFVKEPLYAPRCSRCPAGNSLADHFGEWVGMTDADWEGLGLLTDMLIIYQPAMIFPEAGAALSEMPAVRPVEPVVAPEPVVLPTEPVVPSAEPVVPKEALPAGETLQAQATAARNARALEVSPKKTATVTGGYSEETGQVVSGCSANPAGCAENDVERQLGGDPRKIKFTEAIRPRNLQKSGEVLEVPICKRCQERYDQSQFPPGTKFDPGGRWGGGGTPPPWSDN